MNYHRTVPKPILAGVSLLLAVTALFGCPGPAPASNRETPVVRAVKAAGPAVVNISTETVVKPGPSPFSGLHNDPLFERFFRDFFEPRRQYTLTSLGSGVIVDGKKGFVLTNYHVVVRATKITVALGQDRTLEATVVGVDPDTDLAVVKVNSPKPLPSIAMGNSDDLMIGETAIAIGNPFGLSHTVTVGVISALHRSFRTGDRTYHDFIQTDASINPGNSGGPLLNIDGELVGITTAIYSQAEGIGFAIPINKARRITKDLIAYG
ncbi:MAG: trypsin-like peptidase domain-containing protein, partial [Deltaproteobacteria bacterium]|nr:trypsin-like peptidase domain-containing protein [Deltaproteobacteria bacterium]